MGNHPQSRGHAEVKGQETMIIEFECGYVATNVGMPGLALKAHVGACQDQDCQRDVLASLPQYENTTAPDS